MLEHKSPTGTAKGDRANLCGLLSQAEVTHALHVIVVRAEAPETEFPGCEFSIKATQADAGAGHMTEVAKSAAGSRRAPSSMNPPRS